MEPWTVDSQGTIFSAHQDAMLHVSAEQKDQHNRVTIYQYVCTNTRVQAPTSRTEAGAVVGREKYY